MYRLTGQRSPARQITPPPSAWVVDGRMCAYPHPYRTDLPHMHPDTTAADDEVIVFESARPHDVGFIAKGCSLSVTYSLSAHWEARSGQQCICDTCACLHWGADVRSSAIQLNGWPARAGGLNDCTTPE